VKPYRSVGGGAPQPRTRDIRVIRRYRRGLARADPVSDAVEFLAMVCSALTDSHRLSPTLTDAYSDTSFEATKKTMCKPTRTRARLM
jgi:hypothetical protein